MEYYYVQLLLHHPWYVGDQIFHRDRTLEDYNAAERRAVVGEGVTIEQAFQRAAPGMAEQLQHIELRDRVRAEAARIEALNGDFDDVVAVIGHAAAGRRHRGRHLGAGDVDPIDAPPDGDDMMQEGSQPGQGPAHGDR